MLLYFGVILTEVLQDGLFSAVVTAFLVPAYLLLQQDNSQTSVELLSHISTQLSSLTLAPPYLNSTTTPSNASISSFRPTAAARWINSLWFLSLMLSLTSAVLGILAKQWIREYLKWNSATGAPRDNILVRQIRAEAWEDWHAPALISSIPALLEFAIVLFVCGLTIFLWTLDLVVAIVVTISVVNFLFLVVILTVLPTVFKRCPYRSPTAWAYLVLWKFVKRQLLGKLIEAEDTVTLQYTWRQRDMESIRARTPASAAGLEADPSRAALGGLEADMEDILQPLTDRELSELAEEKKKISSSGRVEQANIIYSIQISPSTPRNLFEVPSSTTDQHLAAMTEPDFLFRALSWMTAASQDPRLLQQLPRCSESIHHPNPTYPLDVHFTTTLTEKLTEIPTRRLGELVMARGFRHLTLFHMLARLCLPRDARMGHVESRIGAGVVEHFRSMYSVSPEYAVRLSRDTEARGLVAIDGELSVPQRHILSYLLLSEAKAAVSEMLSPELLNDHHDSRLLLLFSRRVVELLCGLGLVTPKGLFELPTAESYGLDCLQELVNLYNTIACHPAKAQFDVAFPGLRSLFLDFLSDYARLDFTEGNTISAERFCMFVFFL